MEPRRVVLVGAGGRDFHLFNTLFRDDPSSHVVTFTAAQIPGIADRIYPPELAGPLYPHGVTIVAEEDLEETIQAESVDEAVIAYSDLSHVEVMRLASRALAAGADVRFVGPRASMLQASRPIVAVCAVRTGCGKSQTSRRVAAVLVGAGLRTVVVRHPMAYGDLAAMAVQRFATMADLDATALTIEEREEYEQHLRAGLVVHAGVDYGEILARAQEEADVIVWDGGNNDLPFYTPDLHITVADALRPGHELAYHPGETNLRMADVVVVNKVDAAEPRATAAIVDNVRALNPSATIIKSASVVTIEPGPPLRGKRVLVIEDGPTLTHGGMAFGAGTVAARREGATIVDARAFAVGTVAETFSAHPHLREAVPAMGYSPEQVGDLEATIRNAGCEAVVVGTPVDLGRILRLDVPVRRVSYELSETEGSLEDVLAPQIERWAEAAARAP